MPGLTVDLKRGLPSTLSDLMSFLHFGYGIRGQISAPSSDASCCECRHTAVLGRRQLLRFANDDKFCCRQLTHLLNQQCCEYFGEILAEERRYDIQAHDLRLAFLETGELPNELPPPVEIDRIGFKLRTFFFLRFSRNSFAFELSADGSLDLDCDLDRLELA